MKQALTGNMIVFRAPIELSAKARDLAEAKMISTSAICRQALQQYLNNFTKKTSYHKSENIAEM